jgi:hypothetical protein
MARIHRGVNTFRNPHGDPVTDKLELARSTEERSSRAGSGSPTFTPAMPEPAARWRS